MNRRGFLRGAITVGLVASIIKGRLAEPESGFGLAPLKPEGAPINFDQTFATRMWFVEKNGIWTLQSEIISKEDAINWASGEFGEAMRAIAVDYDRIANVSVVDGILPEETLKQLSDAAALSSYKPGDYWKIT